MSKVHEYVLKTSRAFNPWKNWIERIMQICKKVHTLESGINIPPWINIAPWINVAPFEKADNLTLLYIAKGKES